MRQLTPQQRDTNRKVLVWALSLLSGFVALVVTGYAFAWIYRARPNYPGLIGNPGTLVCTIG